MSRRTVATLATIALLVLVAWRAAEQPVGWTTFAPGPTVNVLGKSNGEQIIQVSGHKAYRDDGGLRLVTVVPSSIDAHVSVVQALTAWADPDQAVYPHDAVYQDTETPTSVKQQSQQEMASSQDNAVAVALRELGIDFGTAVKVTQVDPKGPGKDELETGDLLLAVDGERTPTTAELVEAVKTNPPGTPLRLTIDRGGKTRDVTVTTGPLGEKGRARKQSRIGVGIAPSYDFPFEVDVNLADNIGGPSAGLMFSLGVYDVLTPGSLTDGHVIAGTGELDARGRVGQIGGIQQKLVGAQQDGARLFLVPAGNCAEALGGHYDPDRMRLVKVKTMPGALAAVQKWTDDPDAALPRCTR
jgi:PDZ domain-containing protein